MFFRVVDALCPSSSRPFRRQAFRPAALLLTLCVTVLPMLAQGASAGTIMIKDHAEYNAHNSAIGQPTPQAREQAMESFLQRYPNSVVKQQMLEMLTDTYLQTANTDKAFAAARKVLETDPNNIRALAVSVYVLRAHASQITNIVEARPLLEEAARDAQTGLNAQPPTGVDAGNFFQQKAAVTPLFADAIAGRDTVAAAPPSPQRMAHEVVTTTPDSVLKTIPLTDKEFVLYNGTPDDANKVWQTMKGLTTKVTGKVISVTEDSIELAVGDGAQRSNIADFTIRMKKSSTSPPTMGSSVDYIATFESYNQSPFMITMKMYQERSIGLPEILMLGALGAQGAAAGMQQNSAYRQMQIAQLQAEQSQSQQAPAGSSSPGAKNTSTEASVLGSCHPVSQYVSEEGKSMTGSGHCTGEVDVWLTNHYSHTVTCAVAFRHGGQFMAKTMVDLAPGQRTGGWTGGIWDCNTDSTVTKHMCFAKSESDAPGTTCWEYGNIRWN